ncbi:hypothetical protein [Paenibacillus pinistramenti]|uniref:hypothetical protein n=1 Tax=Paenibacillus pinistramenti TaxID=1768003 RepID=UPI001107F22B|nr:hypothetical protein [Paenibacillus pinistramenti]
MPDLFNSPGGNSNDPYAHKANHDVNQQKLQEEGPRGFWRQITNQLIVWGILAAVAAVMILLARVF